MGMGRLPREGEGERDPRGSRPRSQAEEELSKESERSQR